MVLCSFILNVICGSLEIKFFTCLSQTQHFGCVNSLLFVDIVGPRTSDSCRRESQLTDLAVISGKVAFFARNAEIMPDEFAIFRDVIINHGNGYDKKTGVFKAPLGGVYIFHLYYMMEGSDDLYIAIQLKGQTVCSGYAANHFDHGVCSAAVHLKKGDVVNLRRIKKKGSLRWPEYSSGFSGFLYLPL